MDLRIDQPPGSFLAQVVFVHPEGPVVIHEAPRGFMSMHPYHSAHDETHELEWAAGEQPGRLWVEVTERRTVGGGPAQERVRRYQSTDRGRSWAPIP